MFLHVQDNPRASMLSVSRESIALSEICFAKLAVVARYASAAAEKLFMFLFSEGDFFASV